MGNNSSKKEEAHRRIYVGDVPEIEEDEHQSMHENAKQHSKTPDEIDTTEMVSNCDRIREVPSRPPNIKSPKVQETVRKNSICTKPKWFFGKSQEFPSNELKSSRYSILTFIPLNLFDQFRRISNFYFLCVAIIQAVTDTPVSRLTSGAPLAFVIVVTAVKQGYEDWLRHCADYVVNNRPVNIVKDGKIVTIKSKELKVGNIIKLEIEEQVPADVIVMGSSDEFLRCQITTVNLDGETNLKMRYCPPGLPRLKSEENFKNLHMVAECEQPNADVYSFNGSLLVPLDKMSHETPISTERNKLVKHVHVEPSHLSVPSSLNRTEDSGDKLNEVLILDELSHVGSGDFGLSGPNKPSFESVSTASSIEQLNLIESSHFLQIPLTMDNMVFRGTKVKNTEYFYGLVVYTGKDTRLAQNSKKTYAKFSTVEKSLNCFIFVFISLLLRIVVSCTAVHFIIFHDDREVLKNIWYMGPKEESEGTHIVQVFFSFFILFSYMIPISLNVTIELQKFIGSKFFVWDNDLSCPGNGNAPLCNTSDLNEELGQIEYLFSDKTGTLTENVMQFRYCSINGNRYDFNDEKHLYLRDDENKIKKLVNLGNEPEIKKFLRTLALCHTVQLMPVRKPSFESANPVLGRSKVTEKMRTANSLINLVHDQRPSIGINGNWEYQASSPDEKALLEACYKLGFVYLGEKEDVLTVDVFGEVENYKRHFILEFDSDRKCMSVIVSCKGEFWLLTKGAESTLLPRADSGPISQTMKHIVDFALIGMRTLVVTEKKLTKEEFDSFSIEMRRIRRMLKNREERTREVYRSMESHLHILGATGVEDELQGGVPETLASLTAAGIRIWLLTGDKVETAVNVAVSCGLITPGSKQILITNYNEPEELLHRLTEIKVEMKDDPDDNRTFIIDGESLQLALLKFPQLLCHVATQATRAVCCRMSPIQKAEVVRMVKQTKSNPITAAVGDGANDVAMILEAHIGIAILGKEGRQAARSAEFAVARFSFLAKTILVHGHWYYVRLSILGIYFFYKNIVFILPQVYYCFHTAFSTQSLYDSFFLTFFNIFFAACPIFVFGLQEQTYTAKTLLDYPNLYKDIRRNKLLSWKQFFKWNALAFWHSVIVYFIPYECWPFMSPTSDWSSFGTVVICGVVGVTNLKLLIETKFCSWLTLFSYFCSVFSFVVFLSIYGEVDLRPAVDPQELRGVYYTLMEKFGFWLLMFLVTIYCLLPDYCIKAINNGWPTINKFLNKSRVRSSISYPEEYYMDADIRDFEDEFGEADFDHNGNKLFRQRKPPSLDSFEIPAPLSFVGYMDSNEFPSPPSSPDQADLLSPALTSSP